MMKEKTNLHGGCIAPLAGVKYPHATARAAKYDRSLQGLKGKALRIDISFDLGTEIAHLLRGRSA
jgi:hypothetical protein